MGHDPYKKGRKGRGEVERKEGNQRGQADDFGHVWPISEYEKHCEDFSITTCMGKRNQGGGEQTKGHIVRNFVTPESLLTGLERREKVQEYSGH